MKKNLISFLWLSAVVIASLLGAFAQTESGRSRKPGTSDSSMVLLPARFDNSSKKSSKPRRRNERIVKKVEAAPPAPAVPNAPSAGFGLEFFEIAVPGGPLTNSTVIKMIAEGNSERVVIALIASQFEELAFDLSPEGLSELRRAGIGEAVILAMIEAVKAAKKSQEDKPETPAASGATTGFSILPAGQAVAFVRELSEESGRFLPSEEVKMSQFFEKKLLNLVLLAADRKIGGEIRRRAEKLITGVIIPKLMQGQLIYEVLTIVAPIPLPSTEELKSFLGKALKSLGGAYFYRIRLAENAKSSFAVQSARPRFEVALQNMRDSVTGKRFDFATYEPMIVKASTSGEDQRMFYAESALYKFDFKSLGVKWGQKAPISEEAIPVEILETKEGQMIVAPQVDLSPGEYAVVLKAKGESKTTGDRFGLWSFTVK